MCEFVETGRWSNGGPGPWSRWLWCSYGLGRWSTRGPSVLSTEQGHGGARTWTWSVQPKHTRWQPPSPKGQKKVVGHLGLPRQEVLRPLDLLLLARGARFAWDLGASPIIIPLRVSGVAAMTIGDSDKPDMMRRGSGVAAILAEGSALAGMMWTGSGMVCTAGLWYLICISHSKWGTA